MIPLPVAEIAAITGGALSADLASTGPDSASPPEPPIEQSLIEQGLIRPNRLGRQEDA